jgi:hypothetical protein
MTTDLYFSPVIKDKHGICDGLKYILRKKLDCVCVSAIFNESDIPFLQGVAMATDDADITTNANRMILAIRKYGEIELFET